jgi:hypothetical protein
VDQRSDAPGLGSKQLMMMPARVALALQSDGWVLRSDIVWNKPNPMPESVTDRPTKSHEYIFLLSKSPRYFFDQEAVRERVGETAIVETPNLSHQALVLGQDLWTQEAATERSGLSVSTEDDHRSLFQRGIDLASAILERTQSQQQLSLTTFDTQVGQECASNGASARTIGNPVMRRATAQATRLTDGDISAKEFLREMDSLCIALPDGDDLKELWAHARATTSSTIPLIHANGDGPVTINDASEVGQLKLIHNEEYTMQDPHSSGRNIRSVWELPTESFKGSHFATFPRKLVEPCVLAGTSARGQCPACGAPWRRTTDITRTFESGSGRSGNLPVGKNGAHLQGGGATLDIRRGPVVHTQTTGWAPTCTCGIYRCLTCQYVVEYPSNGGIYDSERSNSTAPVQGMPGSAPGEAPSTTVLQSLVCEQGDIDGTEGAAPHLWKVQPRACLVCQTVFRTTNESTVLCSRSCSGKWRRSLNPNARGWYKTVHGYIILYKPEYPGATKAGYIMEHRWVMEQQLGRQLTKGEVVHHRDGNKANNAPENLQVMLKSQHDSHTQETRTRLVTCPSCRHEFPLAGNARAVKPR